MAFDPGTRGMVESGSFLDEGRGSGQVLDAMFFHPNRRAPSGSWGLRFDLGDRFFKYSKAGLDILC
jgi:hypothetical protein